MGLLSWFGRKQPIIDDHKGNANFHQFFTDDVGNINIQKLIDFALDLAIDVELCCDNLKELEDAGACETDVDDIMDQVNRVKEEHIGSDEPIVLDTDLRIKIDRKSDIATDVTNAQLTHSRMIWTLKQVKLYINQTNLFLRGRTNVKFFTIKDIKETYDAYIKRQQMDTAMYKKSMEKLAQAKQSMLVNPGSVDSMVNIMNKSNKVRGSGSKTRATQPIHSKVVRSKGKQIVVSKVPPTIITTPVLQQQYA